MEIILVQLLLSLFGLGFQASDYVDAHEPSAIVGADPRVCPDLGEHMGSPLRFELNDVPNNITLQIDGYEIAYPVRTEILGASGQIPTPNSNPPQSPFAKGEEGRPRYYILAEPILYRRAGDSEWKSLYNRTGESLFAPTQQGG